MSGPGPIPPRWLKCPRKALNLIGGKFLAFKTPLDDRYDDQVPPEYRFSPAMLFSSMKSYKVKIGLWIDLTNTSRFYRKHEVEVDAECKYVKLQCRGHNETPSEEQVQAFVRICRNFIAQHPLEIIAVHCTHGFNRTGFLISAFLIETEDWSPEASVMEFARARPPGIYKNSYIQTLFERYGDVSDAPSVPDLPDWCFEEEHQYNVDDDGNALDKAPQNLHQAPRRNEKVPVFMEGVPGVYPVTEQPLLSRIQRRFQDLSGYRSKRGFPGAQPVSMDRDNMKLLKQHDYKVSWKADGTRYMMLIDGPNSIFFTDRDHCVFKVEGMTFLNRKDENQHLSGTLLDGEMVIDDDQLNQKLQPRYLVYDIITIHKDGKDQPVGQTDLNMRLFCIQREIEEPRLKYIQSGKIDKDREPFRIRLKKFWDIHSTRTLLGPKFTKEELGHEPDGLIFQPVKHPYQCGRDDTILKWKPSSHNSVDFKLSIQKESRPGMLAKSIGLLYVGGHPHPLSEIKLNSVLRELNNKIIECKWDAEKNGWSFMRERTDKSFPNAYSTAMGVIKSIQEPVTEDMLLHFIDSIPSRPPAPAPKRPHAPNTNELMPPPPKFPRHSF